MKPAEGTEQMNLPPDQPNLAEQAAKRPVKSLAAARTHAGNGEQEHAFAFASTALCLRFGSPGYSNFC